MRVLQILNSLATGGAEKLVVDSVPLLQRNGLDVDVLVLKKGNTPFREILAKETNGEIFQLTNSSIYNPLLIFKIIPFLKKYDVVHAHLFPTLYWIVLAKWISLSNIKLVYTEHSTNNRRRGNRIFRFLDRIIYSGVDKIVTIAEEVDSLIKEHLNFKSQSKFCMIYNGVNLTKLSEAKPYSKDDFFSKDDFILIQVSSFRYPKDQATVIKALNLLPSQIKLILVGDGPLIDENRKLVNENGLSERVTFLGIRADVPSLLKMADVIILSSFHEGMSLSSIEGLATKPFVSSDVPGLREMVRGFGLVFRAGAEVDLSKIILDLFNDADFYNQTLINCHNRAQNFDISQTINKYQVLYKSISPE